MTLGCGAAAGNITSDNVGPQHLYNIKRLAYAVRTAAEAFQSPAVDVKCAAVTGGGGIIAAEIVDQFLARRGRAPSTAAPTCGCAPPAPAAAQCACQAPAPATPAPAPPSAEPEIVDFVCEADVRNAMKHSRKIHIGPKTIVTPSARDLAAPSDILVLVQR
jgi:hypothetical protein